MECFVHNGRSIANDTKLCTRACMLVVFLCDVFVPVVVSHNRKPQYSTKWKTILNCFVQICRRFIADRFRIHSAPAVREYAVSAVILLCLCVLFDWFSHTDWFKFYTHKLIHSHNAWMMEVVSFRCPLPFWENSKINREMFVVLRIAPFVFPMVVCFS